MIDHSEVHDTVSMASDCVPTQRISSPKGRHAPAYRYGDRMGRYRVRREIARGGWGTLYLVRSFDNGPYSILKVEHRPVEAHLWRIGAGHEARIMRSYGRFPGLPQVWDSWQEGERSYIVMERMPGETLQSRWKRMVGQSIPLREAVDTLCGLLRILVHLHGLPRPVLHLDLKFNNVLRARRSGQIALVDFGIATRLGDSPRSDNPSIVIGTPGCLAPEQLNPDAALDCRTDLYCVGLMAYKMLSGRFPKNMDGRQLPQLPLLALGDRWKLVSVVNRAVEFDPEKRYQSAAEFLYELEFAVKDLS